jgi:hypothetical protein
VRRAILAALVLAALRGLSGSQLPALPVVAPALSATAVIRGRVTAADTGRPLRRAYVTVTPIEPAREARTIVTDRDGRYEVAGLPGGAYTVAVSRSGYLTLRYGQRRPFEGGTPLQLADKQIASAIDVALPRMSVVSGRITDEAGEPIAGARVLLMRQSFINGARQLGVVDHTSTDDAGQYRLVHVAPGSYVVLATLAHTWTVIEKDVEQTIGYAPSYFPGVTTPQAARRLTIGIGQTNDGVSFAMTRAPVAAISGLAIDSIGRPLTGQTVTLAQPFPGAGARVIFQYTGVPVDGDGRFVIPNVPPGDYKLVMRDVIGQGGRAHVEEAGVLAVSVNGSDVRDLRFVSSRGGTVTGQILTDRGARPDIPAGRMKIVARPLAADPELQVGGIDESGIVDDDGTFYVGGILGRARIRAELPDGWVLQSVRRDGRDVTDEPFDLRSRERVAGFELIVTDRVTHVTGQVTDRSDPASGGSVLVFHQDTAKWSDLERYGRLVHTDQQGQFTVKALPAGDYLAVAVGYVDEFAWSDPAYLESIRRSGQAIHLADGDERTVSLTVVNP